MAAGAHPVRARGAGADRPGRPHARRPRHPPGAAGDDGRPPPDLGPGPRPGRGRCGARGGDPRRDRRDGADDVRQVHGARALPPRAGLLPRRCRAAGTRRRLPHGARGPSDLRPGDRPARDRRVVRAGTPGNIHDPRARRGLRGAGGGARRRRPGDGARPRRRPPLPGGGGRAASPRGAASAPRRRRRTRRRGPDRGARARERGARRAADASRRGDRPGPGRGLRGDRRRQPRRFQRAAVDAGARGPPATPRASRSPRASGPRSASQRTPGSRALPAASQRVCCC